MSSRSVKRRKLTPPPDEDHSNGTNVQRDFYKSAASWNLEQDYETRKRKGKKKEKESTRLPIKTADGRVEQVVTAIRDDAGDDSDAEWLEADEGDLLAEDQADHEPAVQEEPQVPEREQIMLAAKELHKLQESLHLDPEENSGAFKALAKVGNSRIAGLLYLRLGTQCKVYEDVIPGYRIRPASDEVPGEKVSKEVRKLRAFEQSLVSGYQAYVRELAQYARSPPHSGKAWNDVSKLAVTCACTLLNRHPHFNFRGDLIKILVRRLSTKRMDESFEKSKECLETLFQDDEEGRPSLEAISLLTKMMKAREFQVDEAVVNTFLHLRLLSGFSWKGSAENGDEPPAITPKAKRQREKREFRTKRERKVLKEQKALAKDMVHADALVSHEEKDRMQSEILKQVFATYFRILKLRVHNLMGSALEGLARYAHLINQDFFGDLLEALKDLIRHAGEDENSEGSPEDEEEDTDSQTVRNTSREALLCTVTAFALLAGQDAHNAKSDLHLDLSFFTAHLFQSLLGLSTNSDLELGARSLHLPDPDSASSVQRKKSKVNLQTTTVLLVRCLTAVLLPPWNIRSVPPLRLAAFAKQLMTAALQMPEKSCQAVLALLSDVSHTHGKKINALWNTEERKGDGAFNPLSETPEESNPFTATVWEGELLRRHYCPKVRDGIKVLEKTLALN